MDIKEPATYQIEAQISALRELEMSQQSPTALKMALAASGFGWWNWNLVTNQTYHNPEWKGILGYKVEEVTSNYQSFEELVHPQDLLRLQQVLQDYLAGYIPKFEIELRMLTKSGQWKWIFSSGQVFQWDEFGKPTWITGTHRDITQEKMFQESLQKYQKQEKLLKTVRKHINSYSQLDVLVPNILQEMREVLQIDQALIYSIQPNGNGKVVFESLTVPLASWQDIDIQVSIPERDVEAYQSSIWAETNTIPKLSGQINFLNQLEVNTSLVFPILLKEQHHQNPQSSKNQLWGLLIVYDCCNNRQWQKWEIDSVTYISQEIAISIQQQQLWEQIKGEITKAEFAKAQVRDISRQLQITQGQLLQNDKMANLGQIVVEMANEIYNPVNFIYSNLYPASQYAEHLIKLIELYQYYYPKPQSGITFHLQQFDLNLIKTDFLKLLWSMGSGSERIQEIIFALRNFSSLDDGEKMKKSNLHEGLDSVLRILQHRLKEKPDRPGIKVIKDFGKIPLIECYGGELNQVFMNILNNAIDALEERMKQEYALIPQILIRTEVVSSHLSLVRGNEAHTVEQQPGNKQKVVIHIYDNGKGILPHIKRRIFEPFFTTKSLSKAKGLGLSISQKIIVEKHHGKLKCNSQLGQGTEFIIEMNTTVRHYSDMRKHASF
ncbi:PAS domain-containing protein [Umezakia ovalisporum]|uniref:PAS domain-containing protein n=1 Tax=Umezakia ovalisporum TaxID=75695 RepID=UPI00247319DB|nr:PAS domain-containing protein [Umezakia ovalisporum]MDH6086580.1 PAS domain-containing protein [Umezakia ovalisporum TAC611]MDH6090037.1 PAS domain-containing protein [Umezakia ovalisporum Ak1311]